MDPNGQQIFIMCESKTTIVPVTKLKVAGSQSKVHYRRPGRVVRKEWLSSIHSKLILKLRITTADAAQQKRPSLNLMSQYKGHEAKVESLFCSPRNTGVKPNNSSSANITLIYHCCGPTFAIILRTLGGKPYSLNKRIPNNFYSLLAWPACFWSKNDVLIIALTFPEVDPLWHPRGFDSTILQKPIKSPRYRAYNSRQIPRGYEARIPSFPLYLCSNNRYLSIFFFSLSFH